MFGFANALLLALFAAAGVDLVLALHRKAVGQLFTVPHYLFGDWAARPVPGGGSVPFCWR